METSWTLPVQKHKFSDLYLCFCGYEACQPFHSYGPAVRPNSTILFPGKALLPSETALTA